MPHQMFLAVVEVGVESALVGMDCFSLMGQSHPRLA
jgi:hypothetical protein